MSSFTSRYGDPAVAIGSATLRAHERHGCVVVAVAGRIDARNVAAVTDLAVRRIAAGSAFVLDLSRVEGFTPAAADLPRTVGRRCADAAVDWALVAGEQVARRLRDGDGDAPLPLADSVAHAEHRFDDAVTARRRMLLPLLRRTA